MKKSKNKSLEKVAAKFTALMIKRMSEISEDWTQPWIPVRRKYFIPQNISGRTYQGGNTLMLLIYLMFTDYRTPVFLTFNQAKEMGLHILKGSHSFVVYHFVQMYLHKGAYERITEAEYEKLSELEQNEYRTIPSMRCFDVFNLDQTNYPEIFPQEWEELLKKHEEKIELNTFEMYSHSQLDNMLDIQDWVCPIQLKISNKAYYAPNEDRIVLPLKTQFNNGEEFYATLLHEMVHSTGSKDRLNRIKSREEDHDTAYAKEELVAELSSALLAYYMGIESTLRDDHASYLKYWVEQMRKEPNYLMNVLSDVVKATKSVSEHLSFDLIEMVPKPENKKQPVINEELVVID